MSRTYRKPRHWDVSQLYLETIITGRGIQVIPKTPTKKDFSEIKRDGRYNEPLKWYMKQISRTRRANDKNELSKVYRLNDYEDVNFDDSHARRYDKGIWWIIY